MAFAPALETTPATNAQQRAQPQWLASVGGPWGSQPADWQWCAWLSSHPLVGAALAPSPQPFEPWSPAMPLAMPMATPTAMPSPSWQPPSAAASTPAAAPGCGGAAAQVVTKAVTTMTAVAHGHQPTRNPTAPSQPVPWQPSPPVSQEALPQVWRGRHCHRCCRRRQLHQPTSATRQEGGAACWADAAAAAPPEHKS